MPKRPGRRRKKMRNYKVLLSSLLVAGMGISLLTGCQGGQTSGGSSEATEKETSAQGSVAENDMVVGMIANAFGTQSYNDDVLAGLQLAEKELGVKGIPLEVPEISDSANSLRTLISQGANFIMVPSSEYKDGMLEVAAENPDVKFLYLAEAIEGGGNIMSVAYRENEAAFLGGALAGLMTKTNNVGAVLAIGETLQYRYQFGFTAGVKAVNEASEVQTAFTNSYKDVGQGSEVAKIMYNKGADIIGTYSGACNLGVFNAAKDAGDGYYCLGAANGQFDKMPDKIIASVVKPADQAILSILQEYQETGIFDTSEPMSLGLKEGGVKLLFTDNEELLKLIPEEVRSAIKDLTSKVESGEIQVPATEEEYNRFTYRYGK